MTAQEAKRLAEANRKQIEDRTKVLKGDLMDQLTNTLRDHFNSKINEGIKAGRLVTEPMTFDIERFPDDAVRKIAQELRDNGFNIESNKNSAYKKVTYTISWTN